KDYAFSLRFGFPVSLKPIYNYIGPIISRSDYGILQKAGIETPWELCQMEPACGGLIKGKNKLMILNKIIETLKEEVQMETGTTTTNIGNDRRNLGNQFPKVGVEPESIEIDGSFEGERYLVKINGFPVRLTGKSFKYFTKLAWSRAKQSATAGGWIYKEDIEAGFNQARYLYRMKGEVSTGLNISWPVVENNRLGYYRLNVDPSKIRINTENLKSHPDYEVRSLVMGEKEGRVN
ncbi:MAG: hypothetical protein ACE5D6_03625, partial [Candidatus Zixiibacteriota bacterium]